MAWERVNVPARTVLSASRRCLLSQMQWLRPWPRSGRGGEGSVLNSFDEVERARTEKRRRMETVLEETYRVAWDVRHRRPRSIVRRGYPTLV